MKKYHSAIVDSAQYCKALDGLERGIPVKAYSYIMHKNPEGNIKPIKRDTDICFLSNEKDRLVFFFQGSGSIFSDDIKDWFNNIRAKKVDCEEFDEEGIHKGLLITWRKFEKEILSICSEYGDSKDIFIYGHSRGGGLALLASLFISKKLGFKINCITMGSLRVGDAKLRDEFRKLPIHCTEVKIKRDPVPRLPFKRTMKYKGMGHVLYLQDKWWYNIPIPGLGFKAHVDYYNNILNEK